MKFLISALLFALLASPVQEDQNKYLLIYTALVPANNNNYILTTPWSMPTPAVTYINNSTELAGQFTYTTRYETRNDVFASFEDVENFVKNHTVRYFDGGGTLMPGDIQITEITGFYKLKSLYFTKAQSGTHTEYVNKTEEVKVPSYEWILDEGNAVYKHEKEKHE